MKVIFRFIVLLLAVITLAACEEESATKETIAKKENSQNKTNSTNESHENEKENIVAEDVGWKGTFKRNDDEGEATLVFSNFDEDMVDFALDASKATDNGFTMSAMNDQASVTKTKAVYKADDEACTMTFTHVGNQVVLNTSGCEDEDDGSLSPYDGTYIQTKR